MSTGKVCAVFGFGPGIGSATARKWSSEGFKVALLSRNLEKVTASAADIPASKGFACDVTDPKSIESAVANIENDLGPIHTIIYNAGNGVWKTWDTIDLDLFDMAMKTNVHGLLKTTQTVAPGMNFFVSACDSPNFYVVHYLSDGTVLIFSSCCVEFIFISNITPFYYLTT